MMTRGSSGHDANDIANLELWYIGEDSGVQVHYLVFTSEDLDLSVADGPDALVELGQRLVRERVRVDEAELNPSLESALNAAMSTISPLEAMTAPTDRTSSSHGVARASVRPDADTNSTSSPSGS